MNVDLIVIIVLIVVGLTLITVGVSAKIREAERAKRRKRYDEMVRVATEKAEDLQETTPPPEEPSKVACVNCSQITTNPVNWAIFPGVSLWVGDSAVRVGKCATCVVGKTFEETEDGEASCDGSCRGMFTTAGEYYEAVYDPWNGFIERWSCWDYKCVENWAEENSECEECGQSKSLDIHIYLMRGTQRLERV